MNPRPLLCWLAGWLFVAASAEAHPVAQGSMDVRIARDHLEVRTRVSVEQVFVESSFAKTASSATTLDQLWPAHGAYLLAHLFVTAGATPLVGRLTGLTPPPVTTASQFVVYDLRYDLPAGAAPPAQITVREDVLNEFSYGPGNPWEATFVVRVAQDGRPAREALLLTRQQPLEIPCEWSAAPAPAAAGIDQRRLALDYLRHGIRHILEGWDHLLFMAALVLGAATLLDLLKVVTAFTLAHTLTLTLSVLDLVRLPAHVVEPMIAASIVFVAAQNVFWPARTRGWGRLSVAFGFGLFHGLGFAGGLLEAMSGLPGLAVATAITAFSLGVEIGHQAVVLPVFFGLRAVRATRREEAARERLAFQARRFGSALISLAGLFYLAAALRG